VAYSSRPPGASSGHRASSSADCCAAIAVTSSGRRSSLMSGMPPNHAAAGAGRVEQDALVRLAVPPVARIARIAGQHPRRQPQPGQVSRTRSRRAGADIQRRQLDARVALQQVAGLAARGRAGIEHPHAGFRRQQARSQLGGAVLYRDVAGREARQFLDGHRRGQAQRLRRRRPRLVAAAPAATSLASQASRVARNPLTRSHIGACALLAWTIASQSRGQSPANASSHQRGCAWITSGTRATCFLSASRSLSQRRRQALTRPACCARPRTRTASTVAATAAWSGTRVSSSWNRPDGEQVVNLRVPRGQRTVQQQADPAVQPRVPSEGAVSQVGGQRPVGRRQRAGRGAEHVIERAPLARHGGDDAPGGRPRALRRRSSAELLAEHRPAVQEIAGPHARGRRAPAARARARSPRRPRHPRRLGPARQTCPGLPWRSASGMAR
jgi:hypothetical protein